MADPLTQLNFRVRPEDRERIKAIQRQIATVFPSVEATQTEAIRYALAVASTVAATPVDPSDPHTPKVTVAFAPAVKPPSTRGRRGTQVSVETKAKQPGDSHKTEDPAAAVSGLFVAHDTAPSSDEHMAAARALQEEILASPPVAAPVRAPAKRKRKAKEAAS
jgi:hypothetical protein